MASSSSAQRADYHGPANLKGKIAVVTGGTQGVGEAIARLFAARGAAGLVICGRNAANGARVAAEIEATGCPTLFVSADLAKVADCRAVVAAADRRFGRVDALVNAAGLSDRGDIFVLIDQPVEPGDLRQDGFQRGAAAGIVARQRVFGAQAHGGDRVADFVRHPRRRPAPARPAAPTGRPGPPAPPNASCASASRVAGGVQRSDDAVQLALPGSGQARQRDRPRGGPAPSRCRGHGAPRTSCSQVSSAVIASIRPEQHRQTRPAAPPRPGAPSSGTAA